MSVSVRVISLGRSIEIQLPDGVEQLALPPTTAPDLLQAEFGRFEWTVLILPGEDNQNNDTSFTALSKKLRDVPADVSSIAVLREEHAKSGTRIMPVVRAWRTGTVNLLPSILDQITIAPRRDTTTAAAGEITIHYDRTRTPTYGAIPESLESNGDYLGAATRWSQMAHGDGPWSSYCLLRASCAIAETFPTSERVRDTLGVTQK